MGHEDLLPFSEGTVTNSNPEPRQSILHLKTSFPKIHFNNILQYTPRYFEWFLTLRLPKQHFVCVSCHTHLIFRDLVVLIFSEEETSYGTLH